MIWQVHSLLRVYTCIHLYPALRGLLMAKGEVKHTCMVDMYITELTGRETKTEQVCQLTIKFSNC